MKAEWPDVPTPECDRMLAVSDDMNDILAFLEWLETQKVYLFEGQDYVFVPTTKTHDQLLADFFGIDLKKVEAERRALLAALREKGTGK